MKKELRQFVLEEIAKAGKQGTDMMALTAFLRDNDWFASPPVLEEGKYYLSEEQQKLYAGRILRFLGSSPENSREEIREALHRRYPTTGWLFDKFCEEVHVPPETAFYLRDFLLYRLQKDIFLMDNREAHDFVSLAAKELTKAHGDQLTFFLSWLKTQCKTAYRDDYVMEKRYTMTIGKEAYDVDEYLQLLLYLYNDEYIEENSMYEKAADSRNYADTWLYLSLHFICSLRQTDLERIGHPQLEDAPDVVLFKIRNGMFTDNEARKVLLYVSYRFCLLSLEPNKTAGHAGVPSVKFIIPDNCEVHIGKLLALCEAHRLLAHVPDETPLVRKIADYDRINRYLGEEIGSLFLFANFHARSANKSYLQAVYSLTDDALEAGSGPFQVNGYMLASYARSHKGTFGEFAQSTATYLKDARFSGLTPEFVARELFERGVLSFIPAMLLKMVTNGDFNRLSVENQTALIKKLDMTPAEVERTVELCQKARERSVKAVRLVVSGGMSGQGMLEVLHRIGNGSAFSKQPEYLCLMTALGKVCPYEFGCAGCSYEISTKSTFFLMTSEYNRLSRLYHTAEEGREKDKYLSLIQEVVLPCMDEVLACIREQYGEAVFIDYERMLEEFVS